MLLRDLARGPEGELLDEIVLLTTPIYNIDGNEALGPWQSNRRSQNEPEVVGTRANGQGLDLNLVQKLTFRAAGQIPEQHQDGLLTLHLSGVNVGLNVHDKSAGSTGVGRSRYRRARGNHQRNLAPLCADADKLY